MSDFDPNDRGEYPLGPKPVTNSKPKVAPYFRPRISTAAIQGSIPYARVPKQVSASVSDTRQFLIGLGSTALTGMGLFTLGNAIDNSIYSRLTNQVMNPVMLATVAVFVVAIVSLHRRGWTAFLPGVLVGILAAPLWLFVLCGLGLFKVDFH